MIFCPGDAGHFRDMDDARHRVKTSWFHVTRLFFFNITPPTEIYTLSLHDALPISARGARLPTAPLLAYRGPHRRFRRGAVRRDRKSTRLNSSHSSISYAVFCL